MYLTLTEHLRRQAAAAPERTAMINVADNSVQNISYGQFYDQVQRLAGWLRQHGFQKGDRGLIIMENRPEWPVSYFGLLLAGGIAVPRGPPVPAGASSLCPGADPGQSRLCLGQGAAGRDCPGAVGPAPGGRGRPSRLPGPGRRLPGTFESPPATDLPDMQPDDLASIIYTSGTTGPPKGVMLTHKNFAANYQGIAALEAVTPARTTILALLPLFHTFPFIASLILPFFSGAAVTFIDTLKAEPVLRCLKEQQVTILPVTPQVLQHFYQGIAKKMADLPLGLGRVLNCVLDLSRRWQSRGGPDLTGLLTRNFPPGPGPAIPLLCQRRGQAARGGGREFRQARLHRPGRLRPHRNRPGGQHQSPRRPPLRVCGPAPAGGGGQN